MPYQFFTEPSMENKRNALCPIFYCLGNSRYWFRFFDSELLLLVLLVPGNIIIKHIGSFSHLSDPFVSIGHNLRLTLKGVCAENWSHIVHGRRSSCCVIHFYVFNYPEIHCTLMFTCNLIFYCFIYHFTLFT